MHLRFAQSARITRRLLHDTGEGDREPPECLRDGSQEASLTAACKIYIGQSTGGRDRGARFAARWLLRGVLTVLGLLQDVIHDLGDVAGEVIERGHHLGSVCLDNVYLVAEPGDFLA